jgi:phosphate transport system substrate-binding protein
MSSRKLILTSALTVVLIVGACAPAAKPVDAPGLIKLNASGATFPQPLYEDWAFAFGQLDPSVIINYAGGGSGQGLKDIKAGTVDLSVRMHCSPTRIIRKSLICR